MDKLTHTVPEAAKLVRVSRNVLYREIRAGRFPHIRVGRRLLVPASALEAWLRSPSETGR